MTTIVTQMLSAITRQRYSATPTGGATGTVLTKLSASNYDAGWAASPAASATATTVEVDLGSTPVWRGKFTITDAMIGASSKVCVWQAPGPYTGKGSLPDEAEMDGVDCVATPAAGSATVYWRVRGWAQTYTIPLSGAGVQTSQPFFVNVRTVTTWVGRVRGKIKFTYQVLT